MGLQDYFDSRLGPARVDDNELVYTCPFCGKEHKFYVHSADDNKHGLWHCWHCGERGSMLGFIMKYDKESYDDAKTTLYEYDSDLALGMKLSNKELTPQENLMLLMSNRDTPKESAESLDLMKIKPPTLPPPPLPWGLTYFTQDAYNNPTIEEAPFINYLKGRGFREEDLKHNGTGYIISGFTLGREGKRINIQNHVVFFTYDNNGHYIYWNTRAIHKTIPKSINAPDQGEDTFLGKGDVIFNANIAFKLPIVVLVEGVPDAMTLGKYAVATFGKSLTPVQKGILVQNLKPEQVLILMLDMDASQVMINLAKELVQYHKETYLVFNHLNQDANDLGRQRAWDLIKQNLYPATEKGILAFQTRTKM